MQRYSAYTMRLSIYHSSSQVSTQNAFRMRTLPTCVLHSSPLRRLPLETLGEVFLHCLSPYGRPILTEAPLSLIHVCSAWRKAALGFPLLWTNSAIKTNPATRERVTSQHAVDTMKLWFNRAGSCHLKFELEFLSLYHSDLENEDESMTNALIPYANRLQDLSLTATSIYDIRTFATLSPGSVDALESLYLNIDSFHETDIQITIFDKAPRLRKLTLNIGPNPRFHLCLSWHELTHLTVFGVDVDQRELFYILCDCEQLVSGTFSVTVGPDVTYLKEEPCILNNLVDFQVIPKQNDDNELFNVFTNLTFPALTKLTVKGDYLGLPDLDLILFLQRAQSLRDLTLTSVYGTPDHFLPILQNALHLVNLQLNLIATDILHHTLVQALTYKQGQAHIYLPFLENFDLCLGMLLPGDLIAMVQSRQDCSVFPLLVAYLNVRL